MTESDGLDINRPQAARRYNEWLGGKDNFESDRESASYVEREFPTVREAARQNRAFLHRAVRTLARDYGVRQFLDIGAGMPDSPNTHDTAQRFGQARVVYVDNDRVVAVHGRALLTAGGPIPPVFVEADLRDPQRILADPELRAALDLQQPVGLLLVAVLHFLAPGDRPHAIVRTLLDALPAGSWLVVSHASQDLLTEEVKEKADRIIEKSAVPMTLRSRSDIADFFTGLELAEPGLVPVHRWRPDTDTTGLPDTAIGLYGAIARKPA